MSAAPRLPPGLGLRIKAADRLGEVLAGAHFAPFDPSDIADPRDRALANRMVTVALRRHGHLDHVIGKGAIAGIGNIGWIEGREMRPCENLTQSIGRLD
ncbi:MAG: hypothetical protein ACO1OK_13465, partial [Devosia sp.]